MAEETEPIQAESTSKNRENPPSEVPSEKLITLSQDEFDRRVQQRLARERQKYADYDDLKTKASKFDEVEQAQKTELQKAQERAQELERQAQAAQERAREHVLRSAIVAEAARKKVVDPDAAVALIDRSGITFGEDDSPAGVSEALDSLIKAKSYLVGYGAAVGNADQGARGGSEESQLSVETLDRMTPEQIVEAQKKGYLRSVLGG